MAKVAAVAPIVTLTLIHSVYWTDLRMRAPLVPALALLAATGVSSARPDHATMLRHPDCYQPGTGPIYPAKKRKNFDFPAGQNLELGLVLNQPLSAGPI